VSVRSAPDERPDPRHSLDRDVEAILEGRCDRVAERELFMIGALSDLEEQPGHG